MIILFKIVGGYIGFKLGPFFGGSALMGAAVGLIFGHVFDSVLQVKLMRSKARRVWQARAREQFSKSFLNSLFSMFGKLCTVDGPINAEEMGAVEKVMNEMLTLNKRGKKQALEIFKSAPSSTASFQYDAAQFFELYQTEPQIRENMIDILLHIAAADGRVTESEERLVHSAAHIFNVADDRYLQLRARYFSGAEQQRNGSGGAKKGGFSNGARPGSGNGDADHYYSILGCKKTDPVSVIKQNYRKLASDYHPDKIMSKDLPEDFTKFATEKFKNIQEAYQYVKTEKGFT